jgi:hypothetical protein
MADSHTPIPFTVGDQERLKTIEVKLDKLSECLDPVLVERVSSLEASRKRWTGFLITLLGGTTLTAIGCYIRRIFNSG